MAKVLIVDDNKDILDWFQSLFGTAYELICCSSLDTVQESWANDVSLCILDHHLGSEEPNGSQIARWIREQNEHVPIAWLTSSRNEDVYMASLEVNSISFLRKPMIYDEISDTFARYAS